MEKEGALLFMRWKRGFERWFGQGVRFEENEEEEVNKNNTQVLTKLLKYINEERYIDKQVSSLNILGREIKARKIEKVWGV